MKKLVILLAFLSSCLLSFGQAKIKVEHEGVTINNTQDPLDPSAVLDVVSQNKGVMFPRLTTEQRDQITNPGLGLLIFNVTEKNYEFFDGTTWMGMALALASVNPGTGGSTPPDSALIANGYEGTLASGVGASFVAANSESVLFPLLTLSGDFSVHWYPDAAIGNIHDQMILGRDGNALNSIQVASVNFYVTINAVWHRFNALDVRTLSGYNLISVIRKGTDLDLYVNGIIIQTLSSVSNADFIVNQISGTSGAFYDGAFKDLRIFDIAHSQTQVLELNNNPQQTIPSGDNRVNLVRHYKLSEANTPNNGLILDYSDNQAHGTFHTNATQPSNAAVLGIDKGYQTALGQFNRSMNDVLWSNDVTQLTTQSHTIPTADKAIGNTDSSVHFIGKNFQATNGVQGTFSVEIKAAGEMRAVVIIDNVTGGSYGADIDLANGSYNEFGSYGDDIKVLDIGNGWYRVIGTVTHNNTTNAALVRIYPRTSSQYIGNNIDGVEVRRFQYMLGSERLPYIETSSNRVPNVVSVYGQDNNSTTDIFDNPFQYEWKEGMLNFQGKNHNGVDAGDGITTSGDLSFYTWFKITGGEGTDRRIFGTVPFCVSVEVFHCSHHINVS